MTNVKYASLPERAVSPPLGFKDAAAAENILVVLDEYGIGIARQVEVEGNIYWRAVDVTSEVQDRQMWPSLFKRLDREFAAHLAWHGLIPLPEKFRR